MVPALEVFDLGMADDAHYLIERGVLREPFYFNIPLGSLGTLSATPLNLALIVRALPPGATWSAAGIGRFRFPIDAVAIAAGGHVRVVPGRSLRWLRANGARLGGELSAGGGDVSPARQAYRGRDARSVEDVLEGGDRVA